MISWLRWLNVSIRLHAEGESEMKLPLLDRGLSFIRWCGPFTEQFGWVSGLRIGISLRHAMWAGDQGTVAQVRLPKWRQPVFLRSNSSDSEVFWQVFAEKQGYFEVRDDPQFIIDAGANIGLVSACLANRFPNSRIVALEIDPANFQLLQRNCSAYPQITPLKAGFWSHRAHLAVVNPEAAAWAFQTCEVDEGYSGAIPAMGVSDLMKELGWPRVDLLKIDIEGGEYDVFSGASLPWLEHVRMIVIEIHESVRPGVRELVLSTLRNNGFTDSRWSEYWIFERSPLTESGCIAGH